MLACALYCPVFTLNCLTYIGVEKAFLFGSSLVVNYILGTIIDLNQGISVLSIFFMYIRSSLIVTTHYNVLLTCGRTTVLSNILPKKMQKMHFFQSFPHFYGPLFNFYNIFFQFVWQFDCSCLLCICSTINYILSIQIGFEM